MKHPSLILLPLLLFSCGTSKPPQIEVVNRQSSVLDHQSSITYDSIYISKETIYEPLDSSTALLPPFKGGPGRVSDHTIEYRYRLLRDTLRIHEVDSIPVIHTVEVTREVTHIPWLVRTLAWIGALSILILFLRLYLQRKL